MPVPFGFWGVVTTGLGETGIFVHPTSNDLLPRFEPGRQESRREGSRKGRGQKSLWLFWSSVFFDSRSFWRFCSLFASCLSLVCSSFPVYCSLAHPFAPALEIPLRPEPDNFEDLATGLACVDFSL
jgi:hypothetical protein